MVDYAGWTASSVAPLAFLFAGEETLKPEEGAACLACVGVFEVFDFGGVGGEGGE